MCACGLQKESVESIERERVKESRKGCLYTMNENARKQVPTVGKKGEERGKEAEQSKEAKGENEKRGEKRASVGQNGGAYISLGVIRVLRVAVDYLWSGAME